MSFPIPTILSKIKKRQLEWYNFIDEIDENINSNIKFSNIVSIIQNHPILNNSIFSYSTMKLLHSFLTHCETCYLIFNEENIKILINFYIINNIYMHIYCETIS